MLNYFSLVTKILIAALMLTGSVINCHAYVLDGPHILYYAVRSLGSADTLLISQKVCIYSDEEAPDISDPELQEPEHVEYEEITGYRIPEYFRSDIHRSHRL